MLKLYTAYMYFYDVWVGSPKFQADKPLTYSSEIKLVTGQIVSVPLRNKPVLGFIANSATVDATLAPKIKGVLDLAPAIMPSTALDLHTWMMDYYPSPSGATANLFLPPSLPKSKPNKTVDEAKKLKKTSAANALPPLTTDQAHAVKLLTKSSSGTSLLHGETGSGKTRVYMELAVQSLTNGKSVVILTPEIGLTPQLVQDFDRLFPDQVVVLHSNLTTTRRRDAWYRIAHSTQPLVIIGPRSALFAPLDNIGLIVVDEAHEQTYKQEQAPYYHATRVASQLARLHNARCILGSATPLVQDHYVFMQKQMPIIRMETLATGHNILPKISVVDMKDRTQTTRSSVISDDLRAQIDTYTSGGQQALLFLNRRGSARMILCQDCGWQATCERCDIALTYHADQHLLRCHTCGLTKVVVSNCPECQSNEVIYTTPGTKFLEEEVKRLFPGLRAQRFDSDNLTDEKLEKHFSSLQAGAVDVIIGTQLVTKGLDLPLLGVVGIINADSTLGFPDYTAEEKTYQQLTQVIGRVGRHDKPTSVVIQTYNPDNPLLATVINKDWEKFLNQQLKERKLFGFPPFYHMLQLKVSRATRASAQSASEELATFIRSNVSRVNVRGPSPQLHEKVSGKYNWQIIISSKQRQKLIDVIKLLPSGWHHNIDPTDLM